MREAVGSSMLLYVVVFLVGIIVIFFSGILTYSKAYKAKNRIIEVLETYNGDGAIAKAKDVIADSLKTMGYQTGNCTQADFEKILNQYGIDQTKTNARLAIANPGYKYCVIKIGKEGEPYSYIVVTYTHFDFPLIGSLFSFPVKGETGILGKNYNY